MDKSYTPTEIEPRWYRFWEETGCFRPAEQGDSYCIMLPPPNVTGRLHMGHAFQDTIMDALVRYRRMRGEAALWQGGTDHAGIATQMVVERQLSEEGKSRFDLGRDNFVERVWDWKATSGGFISQQLRKLGASLDWENERFTMDEGLSSAVCKVFVQLHEEGLIYRGKRLVNWDPVLHTALSDLEVINEDRDGHLWHIRYPRVDGQGYVVVATTRPETLLGDAAVAVHPEDERYAELVGKELRLPLTDRTIPVIADDYVDPEFGSGCVKITPAHDFNDYEVGKRHNLPMLNIFDINAAINEDAPEAYRGLGRFEARKRMIADLEAQDLLEATEKHKLSVPVGDRSGAVLEPYLTDQWFVKIAPLAKPAIEAVEDGRIKFVPENWSKTYFEWMHNIQDWCISRQLWWGHRIPAWYDDNDNIYVGESEEDVREKYQLGADVALRQDEDVLDTWFSSALWPFSTLGWPEQTDRLQRFYPTSVLVTGFDIIFFWVARMIMMGMKFMGDVPFREIYIHGLIRDAYGQKMSKSKGNVLDPIDLIEGIDLESLVTKRTTGLMQPQMAPKIEKQTRKEFPDGIKAYGTDALRFTFAALATTGRDIVFDTGRIEGYRNFCNKLWNAARYVLMNTEGFDVSAPAAEPAPIDLWIEQRLATMLANVEQHLANYRFDLAAQQLYEFTWHNYCDWYLELTKPALQSGSPEQQQATRQQLLSVLERLLRALHPIMPFITEEIWHQIAPKLGVGSKGDSISMQSWPQADNTAAHQQAAADVQWLQNLVLAVRRVRGEMNISPAQPLSVRLRNHQDSDRQRMGTQGPLFERLARVESIEWVGIDADSRGCAVSLSGELELLIPLTGLVDTEAEIARLEKQRQREDKQRQTSENKLGNARFVDNAPTEVVDEERQRLNAAKDAIRRLEAQIQVLRELQ
jgi:valyl-tRNA synthetase